MKITQEHYKYMLEAIRPLADKLPPHKAAIKAANAARDPDMRVRWDAMYAAKLSPWVCANVYTYANDEHIDTALRSIVREICPEL